MYFGRHVEASHNFIPGVVDGGDTLPTYRGELQAEQIGEFFDGSHLGIIVSSDRQRTRMTYDMATAHHQIGAVCRLLSDNFSEVEMGPYRGMATNDIYTPEIEAQARLDGHDFALPGCESVYQTADRMIDGLADYDGVGLVVSHNFAIKSLMGAVLDWSRQDIIDYKISPGEIIAFDPFRPDHPKRVFKPTI